ncbi:MAG: NYN domain-containing protein [Patescibacteria group bacterium]|nr:NYN domain-containing protein [Patescibacteria group bacterium]
MDFQEFKQQYYFFNPKDYGRIYAFVDFGNVRPWAKDFWPEENKFKLSVEIDIAKLADVCDLAKPVRKFFYYGRWAKNEKFEDDAPENASHRGSTYRIIKADKSGFKTRTKDIKMVPHYDEDGKFVGKIPKCNFDVEITMDMILKMPKYDSVILFSGDSDFGGLLEYLKSKDKKIVVVSTRNRVSTELQATADIIVPAETLKELLRFENGSK